MSTTKQRAYEEFDSQKKRVSVAFEAFSAGWDAAMRAAVPPEATQWSPHHAKTAVAITMLGRFRDGRIEAINAPKQTILGLRDHLEQEADLFAHAIDVLRGTLAAVTKPAMRCPDGAHTGAECLSIQDEPKTDYVAAFYAGLPGDEYLQKAADEASAPFGICQKCKQPITSLHNINGCPAEKEECGIKGCTLLNGHNGFCNCLSGEKADPLCNACATLNECKRNGCGKLQREYGAAAEKPACSQCAGTYYTIDGLPCTACNAMGEVHRASGETNGDRK